MTSRLETLAGLLKQHIGYYEKLAALLNMEQAALIDLDLERLHKVAAAKETICLKIKVLVPAVGLAVKDAAAEYGLADDPLPTLAELSGAAPPPWSGILDKAGSRLARLKRGITSHNQANHAFVQEALDLVSNSLVVLTGAGLKPRKGYSATGQQDVTADMGPMRFSREV